MMLSLVLCSAILARQDAPITLRVDNAPLSHVMQTLGESIGAKIVVRGGAARDWVCVDFRERSGTQILDTLAQLCDAKWTRKDGLITFESPWPMADPRKAQRHEAITKWLSKNPSPAQIDQKAAQELVRQGLEWQGSQLPGFHDASAEMSRRSPIPRATLRLLHALGAASLAEIPDGEERSYLIDPPDRCFRLPRGSSDVFADLDRERQTLMREMAAQGMTSEAAQARGHYPLFFHFYMDEMPSPLLWCLTVRNSWGELSVDLRAFGGEWMIEHLSMRQDIPLSFDSEPVKDGFETLTAVPFAIPEGWRALANAPAQQNEPMRLALADRSQDFLTSRFHSAATAAAAELGTDMAAIVPDGAFLWATGWDSKERSLAEVLRKGLITDGELRVADGVALIRPRDLRDSRLSRAPRQELAEYLSKPPKGLTALDKLAELAVAAETDEGLRTATTMISLSVGLERGLTMDARLLRIYGALSRQQRNDAQAGAVRVAYSDLKKQQKDDFESFLRSQYAGLDLNARIPAPSSNTYSANRLATDAKLSLPLNLEAGATAVIRLTGQDMIYGRDPQKPSESQPLTAESLAYAQVYMESQTLAITQFCPVQVKHLQVMLDCGKMGVFVRSSSPIGVPGDESNWISYNQMPDDFKKKHGDALRGHAEQKKRSGGGGGGYTPPPQPT